MVKITTESTIRITLAASSERTCPAFPSIRLIKKTKKYNHEIIIKVIFSFKSERK